MTSDRSVLVAGDEDRRRAHLDEPAGPQFRAAQNADLELDQMIQ
jgi:hypothetical protein